MALLVRTSVLSYQSTSDTQHPLWLSKLVLVSQGLEVWKLHYPDSLASRAPGSVLVHEIWKSKEEDKSSFASRNGRSMHRQVVALGRSFTSSFPESQHPFSIIITSLDLPSVL